MIHFIKQGDIINMGLNLSSAKGGFVAIWAWYDAAARDVSHRRIRVRLHKRPFILRHSERFNVIDNYLNSNNMELVHKETLEDLRELQERQMRISDSWIGEHPKKTS